MSSDPRATYSVTETACGSTSGATLSVSSRRRHALPPRGSRHFVSRPLPHNLPTTAIHSAHVPCVPWLASCQVSSGARAGGCTQLTANVAIELGGELFEQSVVVPLVYLDHVLLDFTGYPANNAGALPVRHGTPPRIDRTHRPRHMNAHAAWARIDQHALSPEHGGGLLIRQVSR